MRKSSLWIRKISVPVSAITLLIVLWQGIYWLEILPHFMLPSPTQVVNAFVNDFDLLMSHAQVTLMEAFIGLTLGIVLGFVFALLMDLSKVVYRALYPIIVLSQTVPTVAIAPLLVLWFGYGMFPKIVLVIMTTFFPITIGIFSGFQSIDPDSLQLMKVMGATPMQLYVHVKIPASLNSFFSGLKISASYALIGAVVSEWLGGFVGLGVYMTRVRKSLSYDKMLAVIVMISLLSLVLMSLVEFLRKKTQPWLQEREG